MSSATATHWIEPVHEMPSMCAPCIRVPLVICLGDPVFGFSVKTRPLSSPVTQKATDRQEIAPSVLAPSPTIVTGVHEPVAPVGSLDICGADPFPLTSRQCASVTHA